MSRSGKLRQRGYTMVELMIAAAVIVVIAGIGIPAWERARESSQKTALVNELRNNVDAFQNYATEHNNTLPTGALLQAIPAGMDPYMPKNSTWTGSPQGGGYWLWFGNSSPTDDLPLPGYICLVNSGLPIEQIQEIDSLLDDGDLSTGNFTQRIPGDGSDTSSGGTFFAYGLQ